MPRPFEEMKTGQTQLARSRLTESFPPICTLTSHKPAAGAEPADRESHKPAAGAEPVDRERQAEQPQKNLLDFASGFDFQIKVAIQATYLVAVGLGFCR
jgi:hypothetical protein